MLKRFSHIFVYLLLVLMPLQGIAAANMSICNSMMQSQSQSQSRVPKSASMPCHKPMANMVSDAKSLTADAAPCKTTCKTVCATLCASLGAITALPSEIKPATFLAASSLISLPNQVYASITQPKLQRPPIFVS